MIIYDEFSGYSRRQKKVPHVRMLTTEEASKKHMHFEKSMLRRKQDRRRTNTRNFLRKKKNTNDFLPLTKNSKKNYKTLKQENFLDIEKTLQKREPYNHTNPFVLYIDEADKLLDEEKRIEYLTNILLGDCSGKCSMCGNCVKKPTNFNLVQY